LTVGILTSLAEKPARRPVNSAAVVGDCRGKAHGEVNQAAESGYRRHLFQAQARARLQRQHRQPDKRSSQRCRPEGALRPGKLFAPEQHKS